LLELVSHIECYQQGSFEEAEASFRSQIKVLEEDILRQKVKPCFILSQTDDLTLVLQRLLKESERRYRREQELMLSAVHAIGMKTARQHLRNPPRIEKTSFLGLERNRVRRHPSLPRTYLS